MGSEFTFQVYIISAGRWADGPITANNFTNYKHVVRKSQEQQYRDNGFNNIVAIEDELISGYGVLFNYLVDNAEEDVIAIVDDDIERFIYRKDSYYEIEKPETVQAEFERLAQILHDLDLGLAFGPATSAPYNYDREIAFKGIPGAFKIINRRQVKARMDGKFDRDIDIDYVLQELVQNRICINAMYLCDKAYKPENVHFSGSVYDTAMIRNTVDLMKLKWGKYFSYNHKNNRPKLQVER